MMTFTMGAFHLPQNTKEMGTQERIHFTAHQNRKDCRLETRPMKNTEQITSTFIRTTGTIVD